MVKKDSLSTRSAYSKFVIERDKALEQILNTTQIKITEVLDEAFRHALTQIGFNLSSAPIADGLTLEIKRNLKKTENDLEWIFDTIALQVWHLVYRMRKHSYLLAKAGEGEAIGRAIGRQTDTSVSRDEIDKVAGSNSPTLGSFPQRIRLYLNQVRRDLMQAVEQGIVFGENREEILQRVIKNLPRKRPYEVPKRILKDPRLVEADSEEKPFIQMDVGWIDNADWDEMVAAYKEEFIPATRGEKSVLTTVTKGEKKEIYAWEMERDVTQMFVEDVRSGQVDASKNNGIIDFVWIAILDDRTDECCEWRDGLLTSQIEKELKGKHKDDECQTTVPPAHVNCRCSLAPAMEGLQELIPQSNAAEFDDWLNQK